MNKYMSFFCFMLDLLKEPAIIVALIAFLGLVAQKAKISDTIKGTIKTSMGFLIVGAGANTLVRALEYFSCVFKEAFHVRGVVPNNEAIVALAQSEFGSQMAIIMFFAFVVNILLARLTPLKYIFLTGHHTMFMATLVAVILSTANLSNTTIIISGSLLTGFLMVLMPALAQPFTRKVTGSNELAIGHFSTLSYVIAGFIGEKFGNKERSTEHLSMPKALLFLRDTPVAISFTMSIFFLISSFLAGKDYVSSLSGTQNWIVFSLIQSLTFAAGVYIILQGVKMLISEIIPAFKGISQKLVPGAKPALDCPMVFAYAPNAVLFGFLSSFIAGIVVMLIQIYFSWTVIVPGVVAHFFLGATSGVYGNATGGFKGAILGSFVQGIIISFLPMLLLPALGSLGIHSTTFSDMDFAIVGLVLSYFMPYLGSF